MIPAPAHTFSAVFRGSDGRVAKYKDVVAWDTDGHPMVVGKEGLTRAADYGDFRSVLEDSFEVGPVVGAVPGGGWLVTLTDDSGVESTWPIIAWAVHAGGSAIPITTDANGVTDDATRLTEKYRIHHPDQT